MIKILLVVLIVISSCAFCVADQIETGTYIGSKRSDKYHLPECEWAKKIKTQNERWFDTVTEAKAAGYRACFVCNPSGGVATVENGSRAWMYYLGGILAFMIALAAVALRGTKKQRDNDVRRGRIKGQIQQHEVSVLPGKSATRMADKEIGKLHVCDEVEFWYLFPQDLNNARSEIIIVSPFVNTYRAERFMKDFRLLRRRGAKVQIYIRPLRNDPYEAESVLDIWKSMGVKVVYREGIHYKAAIIDRAIAWEGSLNILQHWKSKEQMTRHEDPEYIKELLKILNITG